MASSKAAVKPQKLLENRRSLRRPTRRSASVASPSVTVLKENHMSFRTERPVSFEIQLSTPSERSLSPVFVTSRHTVKARYAASKRLDVSGCSLLTLLTKSWTLSGFFSCPSQVFVSLDVLLGTGCRRGFLKLVPASLRLITAKE